MLIRVLVIGLLLAGCVSGTESPGPTAAHPTAPEGSPTEPPATPTDGEPSASSSPEASVRAGFVRVRFRLQLTGGGVVSSTFGLEVHVVGEEGPGPEYLCSSHGGAPACREGFFDKEYDLPLDARVAYRFFQELDPSGSPYQDIRPMEFVVGPTTTLREQSYDVQP